ncbi:hypothetical protein VMT65_31030 [Nocardia sp. CDC153]|uniref:hypothetical protein n=1 Tax=Nocardia sp. CDC153 TaxID=3112167 RepID=UPI002DB7DDE1|nr:hypothetical protein [Nocardia sp. CDC153]MEC3957503.1 hypothetical protein [Nocardia sp. CDC153]
MGIYDDRSYRYSTVRYGGGGLTLLILIWLIVGAVAAGQRHYFDNAPTNCASTGTVAVTILAGPLNYMGVNPKIHDCNVNVPQPSQ